MKVTNNRVGGANPGVDGAKSAKTDSLSALGKDKKISGVGGKAEAKNSAKIDLSERAQMMQKAKEIAGRPDSVDEAKVARLQKLIDEGKYKVDADAIADRLVDEHLSIPD